MKKFLLLLFGVVLVTQGINAQQRYFELKDESPENGVFSGMDNEACVIIACNKTKELTFDSSMDKTVNITKTGTEGNNTLYYLVFKVGKRYKGRILDVMCPGFSSVSIPLELKPKQLMRFLIYDPNDVVDGGCYQQHRVMGMKYFDDANYRDAKVEFTLSLECTDSNKEEANRIISVCDSIIYLREKADKEYDLLKYSEATADYSKIEALNPQDKYVLNRIFQCNRTRDLKCEGYYKTAEAYYKNKDYTKARDLYQRIIDETGAQSVQSSLRISEIDRMEKMSKNRERVLSYEFASNQPIGFSSGVYGKGVHSYFTLRFNSKVFDLARQDYVLDKKPELNFSFGWTTNIIKKYVWLFFGPGVTAMAKYQVDPDKWSEGSTDESVANITEAQILAKAKSENKEEKDYLEAKYKFAVSPEVGILFKYSFIALRYTFQYRFVANKDDQSFIGHQRSVIGIGVAF